MNIKKLLGYALGPIGGAAVSLISIPLISWYFPPDDIGRIMLLQTVCTMALIVCGFGLDQAYVREYHAVNDKNQLFKTIFLLPFVLVLFFGLLLAGIFPSWSALMILELEDASLGILCIVFLAGAILTRFFSLILRMEERSFAFSFSQLTSKLLILALIGLYILIGAKADTFNLVAAYVIAQLLTLVILLLQTRHATIQAWRSRVDMKLLRENLHYGMPLVFGGFAYWGLTAVDRLLLKQYGSLSELGVYSMAVSFGAVALIFQSVFSTIWAPLVFKWVKENSNLDKIGSIAHTMSDFIAALICVVGIFSPLVTWILPENYAPVQFILLSSMIFPLLYTLTEVTGIGINVAKKTWLITLVSLIAFGINFALLHSLVPAMGAKGAAMSTAISFWLFFAMKTEISSFLWQKLPRFKIYTTTFTCLLVSLAYTCWGNTENYWLFTLIWLVALASIVLKRKAELQQAIAKIRGRLKTA